MALDANVLCAYFGIDDENHVLARIFMEKLGVSPAQIVVPSTTLVEVQTSHDGVALATLEANERVTIASIGRAGIKRAADNWADKTSSREKKAEMSAEGGRKCAKLDIMVEAEAWGAGADVLITTDNGYNYKHCMDTATPCEFLSPEELRRVAELDAKREGVLPFPLPTRPS